MSRSLILYGSGTNLAKATYEGENNDRNQYHGDGKLQYADGSIYKGEFVNGEKHGSGSFKNAYGMFYEGEWKNDMKHGEGCMNLTNGSKIVGNWEFDKLNGKGDFTDAQGRTK